MPGIVPVARHTVGESNADSALEFTGTSGKIIPWARQPWKTISVPLVDRGKKDKVFLFWGFFFLLKMVFNANQDAWVEEG